MWVSGCTRAPVTDTSKPESTTRQVTIVNTAKPKVTPRQATAAATSATPIIQDPEGSRIVIPALGIDVPLEEVSWHIEYLEGKPIAVWDTAMGAAAHHRGSAAPGSVGNCVISGHSGEPESEEGAVEGAVFAGLWELEAGDLVHVTDEAGEQHTYIVESVTRVQEVGASLSERLEHGEVMSPSSDTRLTLVTCWPAWAYTHRVIVVARGV
jgi:sortase A